MKLGFVGTGNRLPIVGQFELTRVGAWVLRSITQIHPTVVRLPTPPGCLTRYLPETSAMKSATKRWISAGGRL
jgi:hypothetical protein